jgi:hypothetical protein
VTSETVAVISGGGNLKTGQALLLASHASKVCTQRTSDLNIAIAAEAVSEVTLGLLAESSAPVKPRRRYIPEEFRKFLNFFLQNPN